MINVNNDNITNCRRKILKKKNPTNLFLVSVARAKKLEKKMVQVIQEEDDEDMEEV